MTSRIRDVYETGDATRGETAMSINLAHDRISGTYSLEVFNLITGQNAFVVTDSSELLRLRDAITKELAH